MSFASSRSAGLASAGSTSVGLASADRASADLPSAAGALPLAFGSPWAAAGALSPTVTPASPPDSTRPPGCAFGATFPSGVCTSVVSIGTQSLPAFIRIGPVERSAVSVPFGFAHSVMNSVRAPVTSTR